LRVQTLTVPVVVSARTTSSLRLRGRKTWNAEILKKMSSNVSLHYISFAKQDEGRQFKMVGIEREKKIASLVFEHTTSELQGRNVDC
jgi:hypothetical protein